MGWAFTPRPGRFARGKENRYTLYKRLNGPQGQSGRVRKISPPPGFLFLFWLSRILLLSSLTTHNTKIRALGGIFVLFFFSLSFFIHCAPLYPLSSCHIFLYNTQHKHPCSCRDTNPQFQQAIGRRPSPYTARPLGSTGFDHQTVQPVASRYTD
jgi:hypothetical protein